VEQMARSKNKLGAMRFWTRYLLDHYLTFHEQVLNLSTSSATSLYFRKVIPQLRLQG